MAKKQSAFLMQMDYAIESRLKREREFMIKLIGDIAIIALNRAYNYRYKGCARFEEEFRKALVEWADMINGDTKDNEYSYETLDRALIQILGEENVCPYHERYGKPDYMMNRKERREKKECLMR